MNSIKYGLYWTGDKSHPDGSWCSFGSSEVERDSINSLKELQKEHWSDFGDTVIIKERDIHNTRKYNLWRGKECVIDMIGSLNVAYQIRNELFQKFVDDTYEVREQ